MDLLSLAGQTIIFYRMGGGGGLPFLGLADNFFLKSNAFQTIFSTHFVMKTIFLPPFLKTLQVFCRSYLKNTSCACKHMKSLI